MLRPRVTRTETTSGPRFSSSPCPHCGGTARIGATSRYCFGCSGQGLIWSINVDNKTSLQYETSGT